MSERPFPTDEQAAGDEIRSPVMLSRAIKLLENYADREDWGVRELARSLGVASSTAYHLLSSLERLGLLRRTTEHRYRLGWRAAALASTLSRGFLPTRVADDVLETLARDTGETAHLGTLQGTDLVYLAKVEGHHAVRLASQVGQRFPAYATACGKALLAFDPKSTQLVLARGLRPVTPHTLVDERVLRRELADINAGALARDSEEIELHAACAALPVPTPDGTPVRYAVSVSGARERVEDSLLAYEAALRRAAGTLARRLYGDDAYDHRVAA